MINQTHQAVENGDNEILQDGMVHEIILSPRTKNVGKLKETDGFYSTFKYCTPVGLGCLVLFISITIDVHIFSSYLRRYHALNLEQANQEHGPQG